MMLLLTLDWRIMVIVVASREVGAHAGSRRRLAIVHRIGMFNIWHT